MHHAEVTRRDGERFSVIAHPCAESDAIIINCPGYGGDINGYNNKYRSLGQFLTGGGIAAFVQMPNMSRPAGVYGRELVEDYKAVVEYALEYAGALCANASPKVYPMGFSAGAWAAAMVAAYCYPRIKKVLLMEPTISQSLVGTLDAKTLAMFGGELYMVLGDHESVGPEAAKAYVDAFKNASRKMVEVIPNCNHQFMGKTNGQIMAKAPLWAFAGDTTFPSPEGAPVLYQ